MAIEERAHELGYDILFAHSLNKPEREEALPPPVSVAPGGRACSFRRFIGLKPRRGSIRKSWRAKSRRSCSARPPLFANPLSAWKSRNCSPAIPPRNIFSNSATNASPISPDRRPRRGRMNGLKATAAPCAKPGWRRTTSWFFNPAARLKTAPMPRCRCSMKAATPPPSRPSATSWPSVVRTHFFRKG